MVFGRKPKPFELACVTITVEAAISIYPWEVESLRFTIFTGGEQLDLGHAGRWWEDLTGRTPEKVVHEPSAFTCSAFGPFESGGLAAVVRPDRLDWRFDVTEPLKVLGTLEEVLPQTLEKVVKWATTSLQTDIVRVALGAALTIPVESKKAGYETLSGLLHALEIDPTGSSDLVYRINRPRRDDVLIPVNRICTWSVRSTEINHLGEGGKRSIETLFAAKVELDINTIPGNAVAIDHFEEVIKFLAAQAHEVCAEGDVP